MSYGMVVAICIAPTAGAPMESLRETRAIRSRGLQGDRYATGSGSFNQGRPGKGQVTLMNALFFPGSGYEYHESRRDLFVLDVELMWLIGRRFQIGEAWFRGMKYCDPCMRPSRLLGREDSFQAAFFDRGGLVAKVVKGGIIKVGDTVIPPPKGY